MSEGPSVPVEQAAAEKSAGQFGLPAAIAAFPAQAVIQYDHAFANPSAFPNPARA